MSLYSLHSVIAALEEKKAFTVASGTKHGAWPQHCPSISAQWPSTVLLPLESLPEEINIIMHDSLRMITELNRIVFLSRMRIFSCSLKHQENEHPYSILTGNNDRSNFC